MPDRLNSQTVRIVDTTLRDGEQAPGVSFSPRAKLDIASGLSRAGVDEIEAGIPAMGEEACRDIRRMVALDLPCTLCAWCRAARKDIRLAARCGTPAVHISFPTSPVLLKVFDKDEAWVLDLLEDLTGFARRYFDRISVGAQDATRTRTGFLERFAALASDLGIHSLRLADTVGLLSPLGVKKLIGGLKTEIPGLPLEFHGHNDLGMATANAVTAAESGAGALSVTVNGLGERAGNAPLEEVAMALFEVGGFRGNIDMTRLPGLSRRVARASGQAIHPAKPIVGENVFRHESGIHCAGLLKDPAAYQLFQPAVLGKTETEYVIGAHSGSAVIRHVLESRGVSVSRAEADRLLPHVRKTARQFKAALTPDTLTALYLRTRKA